MSIEPYFNYIRILELFSALNEEIGEAQKSFNDFAWNNIGCEKDVIKELNHMKPVVSEIKERLKNPIIIDLKKALNINS